ncbi:MAG: DHH family phosphoesterase [Thermodesulfobacteriota bacterium]|nr:DHH family phosphoesterase [Thermodesulfobacteriota bacterium]
MATSASERLRRFYNQFSNDDHVLIIINADPDSIASAMAVKRLLWHKAAGVTISNINTINRPDNIAMVRLLGVNLVHVSKIDEQQFHRFVIVDSQPDHNMAFSKFKPDVIIDHHPETGCKAPFQDIRPQYGANASIITEYLRAARIKPSSKLATGLVLAIKSDTSNFERQTTLEDVKAFQFLFRYANIHLMRKIEQSELRRDFLKYFQIALSTMRMQRGWVYVHLGHVKNPDVCVIIADFFMKVDSVNWSIISGLHGNKLTIIFRNDGLRKNAGRVAQLSFGHIGSAGGHKSAARAEIPFEHLKNIVDYKNEKELLKWMRTQIRKRADKRPHVVKPLN